MATFGEFEARNVEQEVFGVLRETGEYCPGKVES